MIVCVDQLPGTFEHALNHLLDREIDLSGFDARFANDDTGASAYPPAMLLKVVLLAYLAALAAMNRQALIPDNGMRARDERFIESAKFADLRHNKQLSRFTLREQAKVDGQCKLFALVHNIEKLAVSGKQRSRAAFTNWAPR